MQCRVKSYKGNISLLLILLLFLTLSGCRSVTSLYFYPQKTYFNDPAKFNIEYSEVKLKTADGETLVNWLFPAKGKIKGRVVFFHGNAENISTHFASVHWLPEFGYDVLLVDYRGYGKSTGTPMLPEVLGDMQLAYQWSIERSKEDHLPVFVLGQSIGAALTVISMSELESQPGCLVLDAGFASFKDMAKMSFQNSWLVWPLAYPASWLIPDDFEPFSFAPKLKGKVLQLHSKSDHVVPFQQGQLLNTYFKNSEFKEISGPHIASFKYPKNRKLVVNFFNQCSSS
jgi:fermentation-respiration switch protein FrsA (DUF1100 family)